jgi:Fe-S-cluster containining protein
LDKISHWKNNKSQAEALYKKSLKKLKRINDKKLNELANNIHDIVFSEIDCLDCANCCKSIPPILNETDVRRIAKHLGLKVTDFKELYVKYDDDLDMVFNSSPCKFLQPDNKCEIYEYRPKACREYPHTDNFEFVKNIKLHAINSKYCPAVFHILDKIISGI